MKYESLKKKKKKTLWPIFMGGVQLPQGYSHFEEAVTGSVLKKGVPKNLQISQVHKSGLKLY